MKSIALDEMTTIHLDAAQVRTAQFYAWLHGVSLPQAVIELLKREQVKQREDERAREAFNVETIRRA